jgi:glutamate-1-semialdehyde aminotransferase
MIRFSKTGCDVTSAAIRLARAFTKRRKILCCGYHGWHDWYIAVTDRSKGIPDTVGDLTYTFNYNDIESVAQSLDDDVACVILEPMVFEHPKNNYLQELKDLCSKNGTLLIFDEMWTGFRLASGGAQEYFGIKADLVCYSKAIANGMPISVLAGRSDVMSQLDEDVFFYTTFGGEALSLAAAIATMNEIREKNVPEYLSRQGKKLRDGYLTLVKKYELEELTNCIGADCRTMITFSNTFADPLIIKSFVQQEMIKRGILWGGVHNVSYSHSDGDIEYTLEVYDVVLAQLKTAYLENTIESKLRGRPVSAVFRKTENFNIKPVLK